MPEIQRGIMKSKEEKLQELLVGKTISNVAISTAHGEVLRLTLADNTGDAIIIAVCSLKGTRDFDPNKHDDEALAVYRSYAFAASEMTLIQDQR